MLIYRYFIRCWTGIEPTLVSLLSRSDNFNKYAKLNRCRFNVGPASQTLPQPKTRAGAIYRDCWLHFYGSHLGSDPFLSESIYAPRDTTHTRREQSVSDPGVLSGRFFLFILLAIKGLYVATQMSANTTLCLLWDHDIFPCFLHGFYRLFSSSTASLPDLKGTLEV